MAKIISTVSVLGQGSVVVAELRALPSQRPDPLRYVKAYVKRNMNDEADAEGVCEAGTRPANVAYWLGLPGQTLAIRVCYAPSNQHPRFNVGFRGYNRRPCTVPGRRKLTQAV